MTSILNTPQISVIIQIEKDSILYFNGHKYQHERIMHKEKNRFITSTAYIYLTEQKAIIGMLGKHKATRYIVRRTENCKQPE